MAEHFPSIPTTYLAQYVHDIIVYDQGAGLATFYQNAIDLKKLYQGESLEISLRTLAKTFWIKDEVFVSHLMISPLKVNKDLQNYKDLGTSFEIIHINRPAFELLGKKIEFDFSPKPWMLKIMRHMRILRILMPEWHKEEKKISKSIRELILSDSQSLKRLKELDSIKGYRSYRYQNANKYLGLKDE